MRSGMVVPFLPFISQFEHAEVEVKGSDKYNLSSFTIASRLCSRPNMSRLLSLDLFISPQNNKLVGLGS
jgi:hypothetical protein